MTSLMSEIPISDRYREPLWRAVIASVIVAVLSMCMLDFGQTARLTAIAFAIFWGWAFVALWRRPRNPTAADLVLIGRGCVPFVVGLQCLIYLAWHWRGFF
jgi:hypothetical protein